MDTHPVVVVDAASVIRHWSPSAEKVFGYLAVHAVGQHLNLVIPLEYREMHAAGFRRAMETGAAAVDQTSTEFPMLMPDGQIIPWRGQVMLLRDAGRRAIGAVVVFDAPL